MGHVSLLGLLWSLQERLSLLWFPPSCPVWLLVDGLAGRGWNVADLAFPSPALRTAGRAGPDATCSSVGLLGLASASGPSHRTFYKTAWDSRTGPTILAEASFLVVNGAGSPAVHCSQGLARLRPQKQN